MSVLITCLDHPEARVRLHECVAFDRDITAMSVELSAPGLDVRRGVELLVHDGLPEFFEKLAEDYAGWDDERVWRSFDGEFAVAARFHSGGHVEVRWVLTQESRWSASVTTWIYAGEDMRRVAADLRDLFDAR
jgi:hypothetical protein